MLLGGDDMLGHRFSGAVSSALVLLVGVMAPPFANAQAKYSAEQEVVDLKNGDVFYGTAHYILFKKDGKLLRKHKCHSDLNTMQCYVVPVAKDRLILADCLSHDAVATDCAVTRYFKDGRLDRSFKTPFATSFDELAGRYKKHKHFIKAITKVEELSNGHLRIEGRFDSALVPDTVKKREEPFDGVGDFPGYPGIVELGANGSFVRFIELTPPARPAAKP